MNWILEVEIEGVWFNWKVTFPEYSKMYLRSESIVMTMPTADFVEQAEDLRQNLVIKADRVVKNLAAVK